MKRIITFSILISIFIIFIFTGCSEKIEDTPDMVVIKENDVQLFDSPGSAKQIATVKAFSPVTCLNPNTPTVKKSADAGESSWYKIKSEKGTGWTIAENILFRESPEQNAVMIRDTQAILAESSFGSKLVSRGYLYDELTYMGFKYPEQRDKEYNMALLKNIAGELGWSYEGAYEYNTKLGIAKQKINLYRNPTVVGDSATDETYERMDFVIVSMEALQQQGWLKVIKPDPKNFTKYTYYIEDKFNGTEVLSFNQFDKECVSQLKPIYDLASDNVQKVLDAYDSVNYLEALNAISGKGNLADTFEEKAEDMKRFIGRYQNKSIFYSEFDEFLQDMIQAKEILENNSDDLSNTENNDNVIEADVYESDTSQ